jgi:hypothetical protein
MSIKIQKIDTAAAHSHSPSGTSPMETRMISSRADDSTPHSGVRPDRRMRNWLLLANIVAWVLIIAAIRLLFF